MNSIDRTVRALERALGPSRVITEEARRAASSRDESDVAGVLARCVIVPDTAAQVAEALALCADGGCPVFPRGAGTGRTGGAVPTREGVVVDTSALSDLHEIDRQERLAVVGPGMITADFQRAVEREGLFFPPDPQSAPWSFLGGNVAENAGGPRSFKYGVTGDWTLGMEAALMGGALVPVGRRTAKGVAGYDLCRTLVGSEGTLAVLTSLTLRLTARPHVVWGVRAGFSEVTHAAAIASELVAEGLRPRCIELLDEVCCAVMRETDPGCIPDGTRALLIFEADGDSEAEVERTIGELVVRCDAYPDARVLVAREAHGLDALWSARRVMSRALRSRARHKLSEDVVVPRRSLVALLDEVRAISEGTGLTMPTYGHAGDGNLHVNVLYDEAGQRPLVDRAVERLLRAALRLGGTITGEHGIGITKRPYLEWEQPAALISLQREVKRAFDPRGLLNPDKVLPAAPGHRGC